MMCHMHSDREAETQCTICSRPICSSCSIELAGSNYCRPCLEERVEGYGNKAANEKAGNEPTYIVGGKSRLLTFLLSLIPGVGYLYLGLMKRGLQAMLMFFGAIFVGSMTGLDAIIPFLMPVILFYTIFDTQQAWRQMQQGIPVEDREFFDLGVWEQRRNLVAYTLIGVGVLALLNNVVPVYFNYYGVVRRVLPPLVIIGAGVLILYRNTGKGAGAGE